MRDVWNKLAAHQKATAARSILSLFDDSERFKDFSQADGGLLFDYSKTNLDDRAID